MVILSSRRILQSSAHLLACAALVGALWSCKKKSEEKAEAVAVQSASPGVPACPATFKPLMTGSQETTCQCSTVPPAAKVWGTDIYTADSSICRAAVHAGVITLAGGEVTVRGAPGCSAYIGSARNGVTTGRWGSYGRSFYFPVKGQAQCAKIGAGGVCPARFKDLPNRTTTTQIDCKCLPPGPRGSVWGSDIYTADSSICRAALHAGVIGPEGGDVTVKAAAGCIRYHGSARNGVSTGSWGKYEESFYFPVKGSGKCP